MSFLTISILENHVNLVYHSYQVIYSNSNALRLFDSWTYFQRSDEYDYVFLKSKHLICGRHISVSFRNPKTWIMALVDFYCVWVLFAIKFVVVSITGKSFNRAHIQVFQYLCVYPMWNSMPCYFAQCSILSVNSPEIGLVIYVLVFLIFKLFSHPLVDFQWWFILFFLLTNISHELIWLLVHHSNLTLNDAFIVTTLIQM